MHCTVCGAQNAEGSAFCGVCGRPIASSSAAAGGAFPAVETTASSFAAAPAQAMKYAGFWLRVIIDGFLLFFLVAVVFGVRSRMFGIPGPIFAPRLYGPMASGSGFFRFGAIAGGWLYFALMESSAWQATVGKRVLGLYVTDLQGRRISFGRASGRYFAKIISNFTLLIGYVMAGFTAKKQALHDMIAGCLVLKKG